MKAYGHHGESRHITVVSVNDVYQQSARSNARIVVLVAIAAEIGMNFALFGKPSWQHRRDVICPCFPLTSDTVIAMVFALLQGSYRRVRVE